MSAKAQVIAKTSAKSFETKIRDARYVVAEDRFVVTFASGKEYSFLRSFLECDDDTDIKQLELDKSGVFFRVIQVSGNKYEVPWDRVLYEAEPSYPYHRSSKEVPRIGERIREKRCAEGLSQTRLALLVGMLRPNLSRIEAGKHTPTLESLERIADALHTSVAELLARKASRMK